MKVLIIEDEISARDYLIRLLYDIDPEIHVVHTLDSIKSSIAYLKSNQDFDLILMDVQLGDGICFDIFEAIETTIPIIFTTAYDQFAIETFKVNSIHYLLKPIQQTELRKAIEKYKKMYEMGVTQADAPKNGAFPTSRYMSTFLIPTKSGLIPVKTKDFAFFYIDMNIVRGVTFDKKTHILDKKMHILEEELDRTIFHRVNRQFIVNREAIHHIDYEYNGKIKMAVFPEFKEQIVISKAKSKPVKDWISFY